MNGITNFLFNWGFRSLNCLNQAPVKRNELQWAESLPDLPDSAVANTLSFYPNMISAPMNKAISKDLLHIYKDTIIKRLHVKKEMVDELERSDITRLFHKLNDKSTEAALTMGFSLKQIATIPSNQLSEYKDQLDSYNIPVNIQNQINNLSEINGRLNLNGQELRTGQLCKILNALTDDQRNALTELHLYENQLTALPDSFGRLTTLTNLYLYDNQLTSLPDSFGNLGTLTELDLKHNQLTSLPDSFGLLSYLRVLNLNWNQLTSLPDSFGDLSNLTVLDIYDNQLRSLPHSFGNLSALTWLCLSENQLRPLPYSFGNLIALTKLHLKNNQLTSLPDSFGDLSALTKLNLKNNKFNKDLKHAIKKKFNFADL